MSTPRTLRSQTRKQKVHDKPFMSDNEMNAETYGSTAESTVIEGPAAKNERLPLLLLPPLLPYQMSK